MNDILYFLNTHGVIILVVFVVGYLWLKNKKEVALHSLLASLISAATAFFLKLIFDVPRPYVLEGSEALAGYSVRTTSLPSMHAAIAFSLAVTVALHQKRFGIFLMFVAALISIGRVAANVHYPIDIGVGALVGTLIAFVLENINIPGIKRHKTSTN